MNIRKANREDIQPIVNMCTSSLVEVYGPFMDIEKLRPWVEGDKATVYVTEMIGSMLVAEIDGNIAGVTALKDDMVDLLWVAKEYRRHNAGKTLLAAAEAVLREQGFKTARLECFEPNNNAISFYEVMGWEYDNLYLDEPTGVNKVMLVKEL